MPATAATTATTATATPSAKTLRNRAWRQRKRERKATALAAEAENKKKEAAPVPGVTTTPITLLPPPGNPAVGAVPHVAIATPLPEDDDEVSFYSTEYQSYIY
jgi:hypothetical protein